MDFEALLRRIRDTGMADQAAMLPYLCSESREERGRANYRLAEAFADVGDFAQARVFIERAWLLLRFPEEALPLYKKICEETNDIEALRAAYKRQGMRFASEGKIEQALSAFNQWQYVYANYYHLDRYAYDTDILDCIAAMAEPLKFETSPNRPASQKLRIAYLVFGAEHTNSVLVKINLMLAEWHDKRQFDVAFFILESKNLDRNKIKAYEQDFRSRGVEIYFAPAWGAESRLFALAKAIHEFRPDFLVTSAALASFEHYFIALLRPAPRVIGLLQGPPQQYVAQGLDHAISWSRHPLIDSPIDTSFVKLGVAQPDRAAIPVMPRSAIAVPEDAVVLMSVGRHMKFQDVDFWKNLIGLMKAYPDTYFVAVGVEHEQVLCLHEIDISDVVGRMRFLGWRKDSVSLLTAADILIDTYPSGGGHVLIDAMALGVPFVSFENNYLHLFDQTDWSVADEFVSIPELVIPRGDFHAFAKLVGKLISDQGYRKEMSEKVSRQVRLEMPTPEMGVRALEREFIRLSKQRLHERTVVPRHLRIVSRRHSKWQPLHLARSVIRRFF
jgi:glycosyltransferase involved in cell wall biosynthesis